MGEQYIDWVRVRVASYDSHPSLLRLEELWSIEVYPDGAVDLEELSDGMRGAVRGQPFTLSETRSVTSWGASGAGVELLIDTIAVVGGVAGIASFVMDVLDRCARHRRPPLDLADDVQVEAAVLRALRGLPGPSAETVGATTSVEVQVMSRDAMCVRVRVPSLGGGRIFAIGPLGDVTLVDRATD